MMEGVTLGTGRRDEFFRTSSVLPVFFSQSTSISRSANLQLLAAFETDVLSTLAHHTCSPDAAANHRTDCRTFAAARDRANDCTNTSGGSYLGYVILCRIASPDAAFAVNVSFAVATR